MDARAELRFGEEIFGRGRKGFRGAVGRLRGR